MRFFCAGVMMVLLLAGAARAELVANPAYIAWAKQPVGTAATTEERNTVVSPGGGGFVRVITVKQTLTALGPNLAQLSETKQAAVVGGETVVLPVQVVKVPAKIDARIANRPPGLQQSDLQIVENTLPTKEKIMLAGRLLTLTRHELTATIPRHPKFVFHDDVWWGDVPGGIAQMTRHFAARGFGSNRREVRVVAIARGGAGTVPASGPATQPATRAAAQPATQPGG